MKFQYLFALILLQGCSLIPGSDAELVAQAEKRIAQELNDPASAQFRSVHVASDKVSRKIGMVCGEINAKNGFGGYGGFHRFLYGRDSGLAQIAYDSSDTGVNSEQAGLLATNRMLFDQEWRSSC